MATVLLIPAAAGLRAAYKIRPWNPRAIESYPAKLTSEGVTIAVEPLFTDALAAKVFDKSDIVTRGIMPLAVIICNSNDFAVEVEGDSIELILDEDRLRSVDPLQAVQCIFASKPARNIPVVLPIPIPKITVIKSHAEACQDFKQKFFTALKRVEPHATAAGFLFMHVTPGASLSKDLAMARVYIPNVFRGDKGTNLLFFEIDLKPAVEAATRK